ncbi:hypothetical protein ACIBCS_06270 [Streptomyces phaeochromogenes]|uniref:hypothetical protein n=1 Tax=Streptomyces phaeochromogenes TaxID=1923 RepID=UPI0033FC299C
MVHHLLTRGTTPTPQALTCATRHRDRHETYAQIIETLRAAGATTDNLGGPPER